MSKLFREECPKLHKILSTIGIVDCLDSNFKALGSPNREGFNYLGIELITRIQLAEGLVEYINSYLSNEDAFLRCQALNQVKNGTYRHFVDIVVKEVERAIINQTLPKQPYHFDSLVERCEQSTKKFIHKMPNAIRDYRQKKCNRDEFERYSNH